MCMISQMYFRPNTHLTDLRYSRERPGWTLVSKGWRTTTKRAETWALFIPELKIRGFIQVRVSASWALSWGNLRWGLSLGGARGLGGLSPGGPRGDVVDLFAPPVDWTTVTHLTPPASSFQLCAVKCYDALLCLLHWPQKKCIGWRSRWRRRRWKEVVLINLIFSIPNNQEL